LPISLPETDSKTDAAIAIAFSPEIRITAIAPAPEGEANATIVSFEIINSSVKAQSYETFI
jgi:hypothetical protein